VSRLADLLTRMDDRRGARQGLGSIPHLGEGAEPRRQWRIAGTLVIVVMMGAVAAALLLRPSGSGHHVPRASTPAAVAAPAVAVPLAPAEPSAHDRATILIQRGLEAARRGDGEAAVAAFRKAADLDPGNAEAWTNLGVALIRAGDDARGVEALRRALRAVPGYPDAHRNLAVVLDRQGRPAEAARHYRAFLAASAADHPERGTILARLEEMGPGKPAE